MWHEQQRRQPNEFSYEEFLQHLRTRLHGLRLSTAFSGIDTPGVALELLSLAIATELNLQAQDRPMIKNVYGIEWFSKSQLVLQESPCGPKHLFADMNAFWSDTMLEKMATLQEKGCLADVMVELMKTVKAETLVRSHAHCLICGKECEDLWHALSSPWIECFTLVLHGSCEVVMCCVVSLFHWFHLRVACVLAEPQPQCLQAEPADVRVAGTPCVDFSSRGTMKGLLGDTAAFLFAWIAQRRQLQEPFVVQENVVAFATESIHDTLGDLYHVDQAVLDPFEFGWPIARRCKYTVLRHRAKSGPWPCPSTASASFS